MSKPRQPSFWQIARGFLHDHCAKTRRLSPDTVAAYTTGLESFLAFLETRQVSRAEVSFEHFARAEFKAWAAWMRDTKHHAPKTIELRLTALKAFCKYAAGEDLTLGAIAEDAASITAPKQAKKPIEYLPNAATAAILSAHDGKTMKSRRNRMLLILLYDSAARVSEIVDVKVKDLHLAGAPFISLLGKGRKPRNMPLMSKTVEHLHVYLHESHPDPDGERPLFHSLRNGRPAPLSTDSVTLILQHAASIARTQCPQVPDRVYPHLIRKTRAMDLYQDGVPLPLIMQMLGHQSMATTSAFYAFATQQMMTDAIAAVTPPPLAQPATWQDETTLEALYRL